MQTRPEDGHDEPDDLGPLHRPAKEKDDDLRQQQKLDGRQAQRQHPVLDDALAAQQRERRGKDRRAHEQPAHHRARLGGQEHGFAQHRQVQPPVRQRQQGAAHCPHGRGLAGPGRTTTSAS
ncbi:hypothetical protein G6F51_014482 [Rhizopus arrhizus]|uniref:Uncharacterized protein n=1 Tax=Rhizopus oryzae TaxID=64495 RepID=A0A9P6XLQ2_RHIOR|nr:hypothetical protein G6F51_014482 [Rhizopus arrhizus]